MSIEGDGRLPRELDAKPQPKKPTLRHLCRALELFPANSLRIFQMNHAGLYEALAPRIPDIASWSEEQVLARIAELEEIGTSTAQAARDADAERIRVGQEAARRTIVDNGQHERTRGNQDFWVFTQGLPKGTLIAEVPVSRIGAVHELEPGFLKGCMYILGALFHAQFIRVKWSKNNHVNPSLYPDEDVEAVGLLVNTPSYSEDGDGEQVPWNENPESMCYQWWHQTMVHVDECVFATVKVPGFAGHYVLLIQPGSP